MQVLRRQASSSQRAVERVPSAWPMRTTSDRSMGYAARNSPFALRTAERDQGSILRLVMFGKPGAGKGTLAGRLKKYDLTSLSTGDLLRQHISERTDIGRQAEEIVASGQLVPDALMLDIVTSSLAKFRNKHWILDGFPRTVHQGQMLDAQLKKQGTPLSLVVNIDVPDEIILGRISDRWIHMPSGRVYNLSYNPPKVAGFDDETGEPLTKRPDDNPEIFARRLKQFYASTSPLLEYYEKCAQRPTRLPQTSRPSQHPHQLSFPPTHQLMLKTLSGTTSDEIWPQLEAVVRDAFPSLKERSQTRRQHSLSDAVLASDLTASASK
ncbi:adenylate kinase [Mycena chlorophos]|uniref:Adenylate kinase n=1 Tax=Mycena chlorophos TaxID=658473 RepID=A0A8H6WQ65_MYCCL|nr:adenylate kinase [Mycena chlorophos]